MQRSLPTIRPLSLRASLHIHSTPTRSTLATSRVTTILPIRPPKTTIRRQRRVGSSHHNHTFVILSRYYWLVHATSRQTGSTLRTARRRRRIATGKATTMCFGSRRKDEADAMRSRELDKIIKADEKRMAKEVKLLLLGTYLSAPAKQFRTMASHTARTDHANLSVPCCRRWRVWKIDRVETNEVDLRHRLQQDRKAGMETSCLQQHCPIIPNDTRCHEGTGYFLREA